MNPTPEQLKQYEEDYCADKLAERLLMYYRDKGGIWDRVDTCNGFHYRLPDGRIIAHEFRKEILEEYLARRIKEQE